MTTIKNLDKLQRRLTHPDWVEKPSGTFLAMWQNFVHDQAAKNAPEWRGDLRRSIEEARDTRRFPLWARVFADSPYAEFAEFGTGLLYDGPGGRHERYFPSPAGLREWSEAHGLNPFAVAYGIYERGGTEPTHFFRDAEEEADRRLPGWMNQYARNIEHAAERMAAD